VYFCQNYNVKDFIIFEVEAKVEAKVEVEASAVSHLTSASTLTYL
jgi:hypothetical protein